MTTISEGSGESLDTQVDRTLLSWARTAATLAVVALLFARWAADMTPIALLPATFGVTAAIVIWMLTRSRASVRRAQFASGRTDPPLWTAAALCTICLILAATGLLALLVN
ncbi:MAG: hypothetical protein H0T40_07310 [Geodermatophilaceae bacterium]|nr:hypothetical protein [Geodermatophilaceae bacterium]